jgi:hypothetical protein
MVMPDPQDAQTRANPSRPQASTGSGTPAATDPLGRSRTIRLGGEGAAFAFPTTTTWDPQVGKSSRGRS